MNRPHCGCLEVIRGELIVEKNGEFGFCFYPFPAFTCPEKPVHHALTRNFSTPGKMRLDVMAGGASLCCELVSLIGRKVEPVLLKVKFFCIAHSYCLLFGSGNKYSPIR